MGVVNATPDSFSDGGLFLDPRAAVAHARELIAQGADILDIGGESTRPGAAPVSATEELRRVAPVIEGIGGSGAGARISIDTSKASVAQAALHAGASIVNDVTALRGDPDMAGVIAAAGCTCVLMHMLGDPRTMQADPRYGDVVDDVRAFLVERIEHALRAGIREEQIVLDPGIGFGKTVAHNLALLCRLHELVALGRPVLVGTSRKSFIGRLIAADRAATASPVERTGAGAGAGADGPPPVDTAGRLPGTIVTNVLAYERGASIFRVHEVAPVRAALAVAAATLGRQ